MFEAILKNELYMGYIFGIMILGGFIRQYHVLDDVYSLIKRYVRDNRVLIILTSILGVYYLSLEELLYQPHSLMRLHHQIRKSVVLLVLLIISLLTTITGGLH